MNQQVHKPDQTEYTEKPVKQKPGQFPNSLAIILLVILGAALFVSAYLLSLFILTECFGQTPAIPAWIPILIVIFNILWIVMVKSCPFSRRARMLSRLVVLSVSAGILLAVLCVMGLPV